MKTSFERSNKLKGIVECFNLPHQRSEITQRMKTAHNRIWYFRLVDRFPKDLYTPNGNVDTNNETGIATLEKKFTTIRETLQKFNDDYLSSPKNRYLEPTTLHELFVLSNLDIGADDQKKLASIVDYTRGLHRSTTVYRNSSKLYLRLTVLDAQLSQLDENILLYYQCLIERSPPITLPESFRRDAFINAVQELGTPLTMEDSWYFNFPPLLFGNTIADRIRDFGNDLHGLSCLEQRMRSEMQNAIKTSERESTNGREPESQRQEDNNNTSPLETTSERYQVSQLQADTERRRVELVQGLRSLIKECGQRLWLEP